MPLRVYRGHFRSLEPVFAASLEELRAEGRTAVVASGRALLLRLQEILLGGGGALAGIEFFPGLPQLAKRLAPAAVGDPAQPRVLDRIFMVMEAAGGLAPGEPFRDAAESPMAALPLADFLEELLDRGADSDACSVILESLDRGSTSVERSLLQILRRYESLRAVLCPCAPDAIISAALPSGLFERFASFVFYGIYDLNPLQRRLVERIASRPGTEVRWFTPLTPAHAGLGIAERTTALLEKGIQMRRSDSETGQSSFGAFGEDLIGGRSGRAPESGFRYVLAHGSSGMARAVLDEVSTSRARGVALSDIAVIGRKSAAAPVARQAMAEGVPLHRSPEVSLSAIPAGAMARAAIESLEHECHHLYLRRIPATGALRNDCSPGADEMDRAVIQAGIRTGAGAMLAAVGASGASPGLERLLGHMEAIESTLGESVIPSICLPLVLEELRSMADEAPAEVLRAVPGVLATAWERPVPRSVFLRSLALALEKSSVLTGVPDGHGLRILDLEDARGLEFDTVIVAGLEEGVIPSSGFDDPRLAADLRSGLQIPSASTREKEEAFLLALACGAAARRLVFVQRITDDKGGPVQHSPLVDPLLDSCGSGAGDHFLPAPPMPGACRMPPPVWLRRQRTDPLRILFDGIDPGQRAVMDAAEGIVQPILPFLRESLLAESARKSSKELGAFDGILGPGASSLVRSGDLSPTFLAAWGRCPFRCLVEKGWKLGTPSDVGAAISPDPLARGDFLHRLVERVLLGTGLRATGTDIRKAMESMRGFDSLQARLGSAALREAFVRDTTGLVVSFLALLGEYGTGVLGAEEELTVEAGGFTFRGRADLLLESPDGLFVVDVKTGRTAPGRSELLASIKGGKEYQIPLYCAALEGKGLQVAGAGYFYCAPVPAAVTFRGGDLGEVISAALRNAPLAAALAMKGMYFPIPDKGCERCPWSSLCRRSDYFTGRLERIMASDERLGWLHRSQAGGEDSDG